MLTFPALPIRTVNFVRLGPFATECSSSLEVTRLRVFLLNDIFVVEPDLQVLQHDRILSLARHYIRTPLSTKKRPSQILFFR